MTLLKGIITDSTGTPLSGVLTIRLPQTATTDTTDPDTIYTRVAHVVPITAGALEFEVPETETQQIAYRFEFTEADGTEVLFSTDAIMPLAGPVNFASLLSTGITNRNLDTGALRVARLIGRDPTLSQLVKQPAVFTVAVAGATTEQVYFAPKPFEGAIIARSLTALGISGYELWDFELGIVNSSGNEETLSPTTTTNATKAGRQRRHQTYNISRAASILGLFIKLTPQVGASTLTATLSISYTEV